MNDFRDYLVSLKADIDAGEGEARTREIVRKALESVNTSGDHGEMWKTAAQSLGYVMDVAVNQGTAEDLHDLRELLDGSGSDYSAQPDSDQAERLLGQLYRHNYKPDNDYIQYSETPLDDVLEAWNVEVGRAAMQAVLSYVAENYEEPEDEEDEDEDTDED